MFIRPLALIKKLWLNNADLSRISILEKYKGDVYEASVNHHDKENMHRQGCSCLEVGSLFD